MCYATGMTTFEKYMQPSDILFEMAEGLAAVDTPTSNALAKVAGRVKHTEQTLLSVVKSALTLHLAENALQSILKTSAEAELRSLDVAEKKDLVTRDASKMGMTREELADLIGLDHKHLADLPSDPTEDFWAEVRKLADMVEAGATEEELEAAIDSTLQSATAAEFDDGQRTDV